MTKPEWYPMALAYRRLNRGELGEILAFSPERPADTCIDIYHWRYDGAYWASRGGERAPRLTMFCPMVEPPEMFGPRKQSWRGGSAAAMWCARAAISCKFWLGLTLRIGPHFDLAACARSIYREIEGAPFGKMIVRRLGTEERLLNAAATMLFHNGIVHGRYAKWTTFTRVRLDDHGVICRRVTHGGRALSTMPMRRLLTVEPPNANVVCADLRMSLRQWRRARRRILKLSALVTAGWS